MRRCLIIFLLSLLFASPGNAIITVGGDGRLLTPPTGSYRDSGVQFTGNWGSFVGTAVGPHHFITAGHVGGGIGDVFTLNDKEYTAEGLTAVEGTDLAIWRVRERFPVWAQLYDKKDETGKEIILYGRGCRRGHPFIFDGVMHGWLWGKSDDSLSWGRNRVEGRKALPGGAEMLIFGFDRSSGDEEGTVGRGDSGGGVFTQDGTTWKLAGVIYASGGQYSRVKKGTQPFMAALYETRGLYQNTGEEWKQHDLYSPYSEPTLAFATRISPHAAAIRAIIGIDGMKKESHPLSTRIYVIIVVSILILFIILLGFKPRRKNRLQADDSWYHSTESGKE
ncbi:MAG: hypothetical protein H8F28_11405 [Fibrella sp.]|nr:hypothetical protein [Armatimonadota bacterium]